VPLLDDSRLVEHRHGRRVARALMEGVGAATGQLAGHLRRGKIHVAVAARPGLRLAPAADTAVVERERRARDEAGLAATVLAGQPFTRASRAEGVAIGLKIAGLGTVDPARVLTGVIRRASAAGVRVAERAEVTMLAHDRTAAHLQVGSRALLADTVVLCTGTPPALVRALQRHVQLVHRYAVRTAPLAAGVRKALALGDAVTGHGPSSLLVTGLDDHRLLLTGGDQPAPAPRDAAAALAQRTGQLMYECLRLYPAIAGLQPTEAWVVPVAAAADGWPVIGPHRLFPHHLFAFGTDHDPALAFLASGILARAVAGAPQKADDAYGFGRL
jgi:glycine/D-amino acid oxidase-like deaminating enzyme